MFPSFSYMSSLSFSEQLFPPKIFSLRITLFYFTYCHSLNNHCIVLVSRLSYIGVLITRSFVGSSSSPLSFMYCIILEFIKANVFIISKLSSLQQNMS